MHSGFFGQGEFVAGISSPCAPMLKVQIMINAAQDTAKARFIRAFLVVAIEGSLLNYSLPDQLAVISRAVIQNNAIGFEFPSEFRD